MTRYEIIKETLAHKNCGKIPYSINFTGKYINVHGSTLMDIYADQHTKI